MDIQETFDAFLAEKKEKFEIALLKKFDYNERVFDASPFKVQHINHCGDEFISPGYTVPWREKPIMRYKPEGTRIAEIEGQIFEFADRIPAGKGVNSFAAMIILDQEEPASAIDNAIETLSDACRRTYDVHCQAVKELAPPDAELILVVRLLHKCDVWDHKESLGIGLSVYSRFLPIFRVK